jgi:3-methyladenine DNA glycosylase AlkD
MRYNPLFKADHPERRRIMAKEIKVKKQEPVQIAKLTLSLLKKNADPAQARINQRFFKEPVKSYGLRAEAIRSLGKEVYERIKPHWKVEDVISLGDILAPNPYIEAKVLVALLLHKFSRDLPKSLFFKIEGWLSSDYFNNWAAVDSLCPDVLGSLLLKYPELKERIIKWPKSSNRWLRRAAAVSFIRIARKGRMLGTVYKIAALLFRDDEDIVQKANGWLLKEAGKTDSCRLKDFLLEHGPSVPRTTLRYAIEKFSADERKEILAKTKEAR